ncbi:5'-nucleotidase [Streptosporangium sp. NPDC023615]|uniref:5'-nucleotidase n=1 Tax=Streptosporangium sp. NPDC023615 TaxID=3154794 RepID=UPI00341A56D5
MTLSTTVRVKAPVALRYAWTFSDGDRSGTRTYRVGGKGLRTVRLSTALKVTGDARGWGAVRLAGPVRKTSGKASFAVTCTGAGESTGDVWNSVAVSAGEARAPEADRPEAGKPDTGATPPPAGQDDDPARNTVRKASIALERTDPSKCPVNFRLHGYFEGLPAGAQTFRYRLVGAPEWRTVNVPADHGAVFTTVLDTFTWDHESGESSARIEIDQPDGLRSNVFHYFKCEPRLSGVRFGVMAEDVKPTDRGGPLAELMADSQWEAVQAVSGAQFALVSKRSMSAPRFSLKAGPVTVEDLHGLTPGRKVIDVHSMTGAQLKTLLGHATPEIGVLTPSSALRYTLKGGVVTELTLNGVPVTDKQVLKIAANWYLSGGQEGFPAWRGSLGVYHGGPDDEAALASYIANHSPVHAPRGDRVTVR